MARVIISALYNKPCVIDYIPEPELFPVLAREYKRIMSKTKEEIRPEYETAYDILEHRGLL